MRPKLSILFFFIFLFSMESVTGKMEASCLEWGGEWNPTQRSLSDIPISGQVADNLLILSNDRPDRDIVITFMDSSGTVVFEKYVPQSQSACVMLPLEELPDGNIYMIVVTSSNPSDKIYATFEK